MEFVSGAGRRDAAPAGRHGRPDDAGRRPAGRHRGAAAACATRARCSSLEVGVGVDPNVLWFNLTPAHAGAEGQAVPAARRVPPGDLVRRRSRRRSSTRSISAPRSRSTVRSRRATAPGTPTARRSIRTIPRRRRRCSPASASPIATATACSTTRRGRPVRFSILTQAGNIRERTATMIQEQLRLAGIEVDVVGLDTPSLFGRFGKGDYESIYFGFQASAFDPAMNLDFWLSGGSAHVWNLGAPAPWEKAIDDADAAAGRRGHRSPSGSGSSPRCRRSSARTCPRSTSSRRRCRSR